MTFWEKFFSLKSLTIPAIILFLFGFLYLFIVSLKGLVFVEFELYFFAILGFVLGLFINFFLFSGDEDDEDKDKNKDKDKDDNEEDNKVLK